MSYAIAEKEVVVRQEEADLLALTNLLKQEGDVDYDRKVRSLALAEREVELLRVKKKALEDTIKPLKQIEEAAKQTFEKGMADAIMGVVEGTQSMKEGFLSMAKAVLVAIAQIIAQLIAMKILQAATSFFGGGMAEGGVISKASGGYIGRGRKPRGYRSGGIATQPTYLVGEGRYNEAVVPLPDGRSIPVEMKGGASNVVVNVNIASDGQTTSALESDQGQQAANLGRAISVAVTEELYKQKRPGGALSPYGGG
jgi:phage-related minor tail protein